MNEVEAYDPVSTEIAQIQERMTVDRAGYFKDTAMQERYRELIRLTDAGQEVTGDKAGALRTVAEVKKELGEGYASLERNFDALPDTVIAAVRESLLWGKVLHLPPASDRGVIRFATTAPGKALVAEWGWKAHEKLAQLRERLWRIYGRLNDRDYETASLWFEHLDDAEFKAVCRALGG